MNNAEFLIELKKQISEAKVKKSQLEGRLQTFEENLKNDFECATLKEAENLLIFLNKEINEKETILEEKIQEIKNLL